MGVQSLRCAPYTGQNAVEQTNHNQVRRANRRVGIWVGFLTRGLQLTRTGVGVVLWRCAPYASERGGRAAEPQSRYGAQKQNGPFTTEASDRRDNHGLFGEVGEAEGEPKNPAPCEGIPCGGPGVGSSSASP
jgi:hypothetical protein